MRALLLLLLWSPAALAQVAPPVVVRSVEPAYPPDAKQEGVQGTVILALTLDDQGRVIDAKVTQGVDPRLDEAALEAGLELQFEAGEDLRLVAYAFTFKLSRSEVGGPPAPATLHGSAIGPEGEALEGAHVLLYDLDNPNAPPVALEAGTRGKFTAPFLHPGHWTVEVIRDGYVTRTFDLVLEPGQVVEGEFQLPIDDLLEVVVFADRPTWREVDRGERTADPEPVTGVYTLTRADIESTPGSMEDVVRATHALPGVVSDGDLLSGVYVRGGEQSDVVYLLDGVPLTSPFHLAGFNSVFNPDMIESVRFFAGAPPADVPSGTSAVMEVQSWDGRPREPGGGLDGAIDLSAAAARGFLLGPIDKKGHWTFAIAARRTYLEAYLSVMKWVNILDSAFVAPAFSELSGRLSWRPDDRHQTILTVLQGGDALGVVDSDDDSSIDVDATFELNSSLTLVSLAHTWTPSPDGRLRAVAAWTTDRSRETRDLAGEAERKDRLDRLYGRIDGEWRAGPVLLQGGGDVSALHLATSGTVQDDRAVPTWTQAGLVDLGLGTMEVDSERRWVEGSVYGQLGVEGPVNARAGIRVTPRRAEQGGPEASPSIGISVPLPTGTIPKVSWGLYHQAPIDPIELDPVAGNPDLDEEHASHLVVGIDQGFAFDKGDVVGLFRVEGYRIGLRDLVVNPDDATTLETEKAYTNDGSGTTIGLDVLALARAGRWSAQISWSLLQALRTNPRNTVFEQTVPPPQDQRHTFTAMGDWQAFPHWTFTGRYTFHTGRPASMVAPAGPDTAALTCLNCDRLGDTHQVDLRVEWHRAYRLYRLSFYLEVLNVGNVHSTFLPIHTVEDGELTSSTLDHLPMRPFLGLRFDF